MKQLADTNIFLEIIIQYALAKKHDFTVVSFDKDFDATDRGRKSPADILA